MRVSSASTHIPYTRARGPLPRWRSTHLDLQLQHAPLEALRQLPRLVWVQVEVGVDALLQAAVLAARALHKPAGGGGRQVARQG